MYGEVIALLWGRLLNDYAPRIGWACYHSLWQGLVIAGLLRLALYAISRFSQYYSKLRYSISLLALLAIPILGLGTFLSRDSGVPRVVLSDDTSGISIDRFLSTVALHKNLPILYDLRSWMERFIPAIGILWTVGFSIAVVRLVRGWFFAHRLVRQAKSFDDPLWQGHVERLSDAMVIRRSVRLLKSESINTPSVVGWFSPVILWPTSAITGISVQGISAIIAHELAHIRRSDFILNVLQCVIDAVYFYHPATWWISRKVRLEREHCADELAVQMLESSSLGTRLGYGQTLLDLEEYRPAQVFTIRATGGFLLPRIRRITGNKEPGISFPRLIASLLIIATFAGVQTSLALAIKPHSKNSQYNVSADSLRTDPATTGDPPNALAVVVTEPIAQAIVARLEAQRIDTDALWSVRDGMWGAIREGKPLVLQQVYAILMNHGYDPNIVHAPPAHLKSPTSSNEPTLVTEPIAKAIVDRLAAQRIDTVALCAVRDAMWDAIRNRRPLTLEQVHTILAQYGYNSSTLHSPPPQ